MLRRLILAVLSVLLLSSAMSGARAWSNGGFSTDPSNPKYGTHDWIAEHALDWLPASEKQYLVTYITTYLYATELPDQTSTAVADHIGDTTKHHIYFRSDGSLQDDAAATRASEEFTAALSHLKARRKQEAAQRAGVMSHYIADMAVFGHVMGSGTDWGAEEHHQDYEDYVKERTGMTRFGSVVYESPYFTLSFDGSLASLSAYDAALNLAYNTTFGSHGSYGCRWMDANYGWGDSAFRERCNESLNLAVNALADVLHTLYLEAGLEQISAPSISTTLLIEAGAAVAVVIVLALALRRPRRR